MDDLRRVPPPFPPLALRERGNFISVRQKPDQDAGWGTLSNPKRFELPLLTPHLLRSTLGFEAEPASEFWQFSINARVRLQVNRISEDRYASCVGVALLDQNNRRVAPLVQSAGGRGEPVEIGPGLYKVCASLGIAERLKELRLEFIATPVGGALQGMVTTTAGGLGVMLRSGAGVRGGAMATASGAAALQQPAGLLHGRGIAVAGGAAVPGRRSAVLRAEGGGGASGAAVLTPCQPEPLQGSGSATAGGAVRWRTVRWRDEPQSNWRARQVGDVVEFNRSYVLFNRDPISQRALLQQLELLLN